MHFTAGACPVGCGEVAFATPIGGGPVLLFCDSCMCVWPDPAALDGVDDYKQLADYGTTEGALRAATRPEIEAADLWPWVVKRRETEYRPCGQPGRKGELPTPLTPVALRAPEGGYLYFSNRWYRCRKCCEMIASATRRSAACWCRNVELDAGYGRLSLKDEAQVEAFVDAPDTPTTIHVRLLGEGTGVWRPVLARPAWATAFEILSPANSNRTGERWEFVPGTTVVCERHRFADGEGLVAVRAWPFASSPIVAAFTTADVVERGLQIVQALHSLYGSWEFHPASGATHKSEEHRIASLESILVRDTSLAELGDLPCGWQAVRSGPGAAWIREPHVPPSHPLKAT